MEMELLNLNIFFIIAKYPFKAREIE